MTAPSTRVSELELLLQPAGARLNANMTKMSRLFIALSL
jgi:hypothetical protein